MRPETHAWASITRRPTVPSVVLHLGERSRPTSLLRGVYFERPVHVAVLHDRLCRFRHAGRERPKQRRVKRAPARHGRRRRIPHARKLFCESDGKLRASCPAQRTHRTRGCVPALASASIRSRTGNTTPRSAQGYEVFRRLPSLPWRTARQSRPGRDKPRPDGKGWRTGMLPRWRQRPSINKGIDPPLPAGSVRRAAAAAGLRAMLKHSSGEGVSRGWKGRGRALNAWMHETFCVCVRARARACASASVLVPVAPDSIAAFPSQRSFPRSLRFHCCTRSTPTLDCSSSQQYARIWYPPVAQMMLRTWRCDLPVSAPPASIFGSLRILPNIESVRAPAREFRRGASICKPVACPLCSLLLCGICSEC